MKKILTLMALGAMIVFAGCSKRELSESTGQGCLQLSITASTDELTVKSAADNVDVDTFIITITSTTNSAYKFQYTFADFKSTYEDNTIYLDPGNYTIDVTSPDTEDVEWEQPIFGCTADFTILDEVITPLELVCTIQNMMVTVETTEDFQKEFYDYNIVVSGTYNGQDESLTWTEDIIKAGTAGYFKVSDLTVSIRGIREIGSVVTQTRIITDTAPADHHRIIIGAVSTGAAGVGISIDDSVNDKEVDIIVPGFDETEIPDEPETPEEPENPEESAAPTLTWASNPDFAAEYLAAQMDVELEVTAEAGIAGFLVDIDSDVLAATLSAVGISVPIDLINISGLAKIALKAYGLPLGDDLKDQTYVDLQLSSLVATVYSLGPAAGSEHIFTLTITDNDGQELVQTLTFIMPEAEDDGEEETPEEPVVSTAPTLTWDTNPNFEPMYLATEMDVNLVVNAPEGIAEFLVDIDSDILAGTLAQMGITPPMDMINGIMVKMIMGQLGLPVGDELKNQTTVNFSLSTLVPMIYALGPEAGSKHIFTLTVTDNIGQTLEQTLTFIMPEE